MVREARRRRGRGPAARRGDDRQGHRDHPVAQARDGSASSGRRGTSPRSTTPSSSWSSTAAPPRWRRSSRCPGRPRRRRSRPAVRSRRRGPGGRGRAVHRAAPGGNGKALAAPAVRALARELGVDLQQVAGHRARGQGHQGRRAARSSTAGQAGAGRGPAGCGRRRPGHAWRSSRSAACAGASPRRWRSPSGRRPTSPSSSRWTRPSSSRMKDRMATGAAAEGVKLTFLPFVLKAAVAALRKFPQLNASFDEAAGRDPPQALVRPRHRRGHRPGAHRAGGPARRPALHRRPGARDRAAGRRQPGRAARVRRTSGTPPSRSPAWARSAACSPPR